MKQIFISVSGAEPRWREAFPSSLIVDMTQLNDLVDAVVSVWVDSSSLSHMSLLATIKEIALLGAKVIVMSPSPTDAEGLAAVQAGAVGYCHRLAHPIPLKEIAVVVEHGGLWLGPQLLQKIAAASVWVGQQTPSANAGGLAQQSLAKLTARESLVAQEVAKGATNREIAEVLSVSERTVKAHLTSVFEKLSVRDRVQLALLMNNVQFNAATQAVS